MDAQSLFRDGVTALRDQHDASRARQLLTQSLKLDPNNEMAWLWLSRTTHDPQKQMQCVERALRINPNNPQALALRAKLTPPAPSANATPASMDDLRAALSQQTIMPPAAVSDQQAVDALLAEAEQRVRGGRFRSRH